MEFWSFNFFENFNYEIQRLVISGSLFIIGYILHRKYSFRDYKKVGVAVYANGVENLKKIHDRIGQHCDFIHVDVVDNTMSKEAEEIKAYKIGLKYVGQIHKFKHILCQKNHQFGSIKLYFTRCYLCACRV